MPIPSNTWAGRARALAAVLSLLFVAALLPGQAPTVALAPPALLHRFDVTAGTLQGLTLPAAPLTPFTVAVQLGAAVRQLELHPHDVRAPHCRLLEATGQGIRELPLPPSVTFRGTVAGEIDSRVAATVVGGQLTALVEWPAQAGTWAIQPASSVDPRLPPALHVVYHSSDNRNLPFRCGTTAPPVAAPATPSIELDMQAQIACEADYPFFQINGSVTATQNDITGVINAMDVIYRGTVQIRYQITTILVRSTGDPYTTTNSSALLGQFANLWNATQGAVQRDLAHLFTGRNVDGAVIGVAYLGTVCSLGNAYGLSQSRFTTNMTRRVGLTSHEVGHNWNASHCDGAPDCAIMCATLGNCAGGLTTFGVTERNQITAFKNTRTCLTPVTTSPVITGLSQVSVPAFQPPPITIHGTGFTGVTQVSVNHVALPFGQFTVLGDTQIRFTPPAPASLSFVPVTVTNTAGTSNPWVLLYTAASPPGLAAPVAAIGGQPITWSCGGLSNHLWFLMVSLNSQTAPFQGWPLLQNSSVLYLGTLDGAGLGSHTLTVPPGILSGITVHAQMLDVDGTALTLTGSSPVRSTYVWL